MELIKQLQELFGEATAAPHVTTKIKGDEVRMDNVVITDIAHAQRFIEAARKRMAARIPVFDRLHSGVPIMRDGRMVDIQVNGVSVVPTGATLTHNIEEMETLIARNFRGPSRVIKDVAMWELAIEESIAKVKDLIEQQKLVIDADTSTTPLAVALRAKKVHAYEEIEWYGEDAAKLGSERSVIQIGTPYNQFIGNPKGGASHTEKMIALRVGYIPKDKIEFTITSVYEAAENHYHVETRDGHKMVMVIVPHRSKHKIHVKTVIPEDSDAYFLKNKTEDNFNKYRSSMSMRDLVDLGLHSKR